MTAEPNYFNENKFGKYFLIIVTILSLVLFIGMIKMFLMPIVLSVILSIITYPLYKLILNILKGRSTLASLLCCIIVLLVILLPLTFISRLLISQSIELYRTAGPQIDDLVQKGSSGIGGKIMNSFAGQWLSVHDITFEWKTLIDRVLEFLGSTIPTFINKSSRATASVMFNTFIIIFSLFYFLRDGKRFIVYLKDMLPISEDYKEKIISRFYVMSNATIKGVLMIALLQSFLATTTLWLFGIETWLLWGMVILVFSVIPFMGTGAILIPAGIIKIISGNVGQGIAIILISIFIISLIDNIIRPRIIGRDAGIHDLVVFFSIIGGIFTFGPAGFIIGPLIASVFLTILDIYKIEFLSHINTTRK